MTRILLVVAVGIAGLLFLVPADPEPVPAPAPAAADPITPPAAPRVIQVRPAAGAVPVAVNPDPNERTPLIAQMARLEARRRLGRAGTATYLDSLFTSADSTVRRWDERPVVVVSVTVPADAPQLAAAARAGLRYWEDLGLGFAIAESTDPTAADIVLDWIERFDSTTAIADTLVGRTGLTEVQATDRGRIEHARITLARRDIRGKPLAADAIRAIAAHEFGHALGLPHSGRRDDIMYPTVIALQPSARDRATATLLYALPPGPLQEPPTR